MRHAREQSRRKTAAFLAGLLRRRGMPGEKILQLAGRAMWRKFSSRQPVFSRSEAADRIWFIYSGALLLSTTLPSGKVVANEILSPGQFAGCPACVSNSRYCCRAKAL